MKKRNRKDRRDGYFVDKCDVMHLFMPYILPDRIANEAVMNEPIDLTAVINYVDKKNVENPSDFKYTMFHVFTAAMAKTIFHRPKLNRFYIANRYYERKDISFAFVVKKQLTDTAEEALAIITVDPEGECPIEQIHNKIKDFVFSVRKENKTEGTTDIMNILTRLPRWLLKFTMAILRRLDYYDLLPMSVLKEDPYHCSAFISNLGSIKMHASYHHLTNWGTNSLFIVIGEKKKKPVYLDDGTVKFTETLNLGMTVDERIADGVYFANSVKLFKKLLDNPELLEKDITEPVEL